MYGIFMAQNCYLDITVWYHQEVCGGVALNVAKVPIVYTKVASSRAAIIAYYPSLFPHAVAEDRNTPARC